MAWCGPRCARDDDELSTPNLGAYQLPVGDAIRLVGVRAFAPLQILAGDSPNWTRSRPPFLVETSWPGVFAAGDVRLGSVKRVASAVGEGSMAVKFVHEYLAVSSS